MNDVLRSGTARLVTGFPGFAARHVVGLLARRDELHNFLLVEPTWVFEAHRACLAIELASPGFGGRWTVVVGDPRSPDLGMSDEALRLAIDSVCEVWHLDGTDDLEVTERDAYAQNVQVTRRVLGLADRLPLLARLVYRSTAMVAGQRQGRVYEAELDRGQRFAHVCQATRLWAEAEVRDAANRLPTIIVRPSILVGAWKFGSGGPGADPTAFMAAVRGSSRWSSSFRSSRHLGVNFVPVTYVAEAMVRIAASERSLGRTFHLTDPDPLSLEALADLEHEVLAAPALGRTLSRLERVFRRATHSRPVAWRSWVTEARYDASNSASVLGDFHPPSAAVTWSGLRTVPRAADWLLSMRAS